MITLKNYDLSPELIDFMDRFPDCAIAGGAARSELTEEAISDYDVFFDPSFSDEEFDEVAADFEKHDFKIVFKCPAGELITVKHKNGKHIQLIRKVSFDPRNPNDLIDGFDFTVTQFVAFKNGANQYCLGVGSQRTLKDTVSKTLRLHTLSYPASTMNRAHKYRNKGYKPAKNLYADLAREISSREWSDEEMELYPID